MAVEPVLASTLWSAHQHEQPTSNLAEPPSKRRKLATNCKPLDDALSGGFDYGAIHCISAETDAGSKQLSQALIASHLLDSEDAEAAVIDTINSFDVRGLHQMLVAELRLDGKGDSRERAVQVLGRVRIMKAFDFVGLTECVAELREHLEADAHPRPSRKTQAQQPPRGTVGDSEDEDEILDSLSPPKHRKASPATEPPPEPKQSSKLLIIDNITHATLPLLKNSHIQGQALLTSFMRSLAHLTRAHQLCTVVQNAASVHSPASVSAQVPSPAEDRPSIFSSCTLRPALGRTFAYLVDAHYLLHRVPLEAEDAKGVYSTQGPSRMAGQRKVVSVLEVLTDRHSDRVGHWVAFHPDAEGKLIGIT